MNTQSERRTFTRYPIEFPVDVTAEDSQCTVFKEQTTLEEISGSGARFVTQLASRYTPGQSLEMTIYLPGTNDVKANMRAKATVVRIDQVSASRKNSKDPEMRIAVKLDTSLHFERSDVREKGSYGEPSRNP